MRTNIDIDEKLVTEAMRRTGLKTKRAVVHEALQRLVQIERQHDVRELRGIWADDPDAWSSAAGEDGDDADSAGTGRS
jgi:Arc/MetJ family transcription regulator